MEGTDEKSPEPVEAAMVTDLGVQALLQEEVDFLFELEVQHTV